MTPLTAVAVDPLLDGRWAELVERAPAGSVFHHPAWLGLLHSQYGFSMRACCLAQPDGRLVAGLPYARVGSRIAGRRLVALPFSDECPPLLAADAPGGIADALAGALEAARGALPLEVRGAGELLATAPQVARFHSHVLALDPDVEAVARSFRKSFVRRGVRRARREGLTVERRTDADALAAFYRLHVATRARLGVPTQPRRFVLRFAELFARDLGFVLIARHERRPVAAAVFLTHRDVMTYKYGASDARFLRLRPNNLVFMEAIEWGCGAGMRALDFGRTDWGHESLRAFKLAWGADERELTYQCLGGRVRAPAPPGQARRLAAAVLRRSPPIVSRVTGEVLYRHAA